MSKRFILGLTGSIGMGKSTTASLFASFGCAVWDADAAVHRLYSKNGLAVPAIKALYANAVQNGVVDREILKAWIEADKSALPQIEAVVHPLVKKDRQEFIEKSASDIIVLDIPLLFENGSEGQMDAVAVVSVSAETQRARVLARNTMSVETFEAIVAKQMPDEEKRKRADIIIPTETLAETKQIVVDIVARIKKGAFHA